MGPLQRPPGTAPTAFSQDPPWLRRRERISLVKNRMREICTSGSVRGGGGDVPTCSALGVPNWRQVAPECGGLLQMAVRGEELQLFSAEGLLQVVQELAPEHLRQHSDWQKEPRPAGNPTFAVRRDATPRDEKMNVRVVTPTPTIP